MAIDRRFLNWGIFFIALGGVPLLVREGLVSQSTAGEAWRLWPLVIVGIGVAILLRRTPAAFAGGLIVAATFGLVTGGLLASGPQLVSVAGCGNPNAGAGAGGVTSDASGTFGSTASARIQMDCGVLNVATRPGSGWTFRGRDPQDGRAIVESSSGSLQVTAPARSDAFWNLSGSHNRSWTLALPTASTVDLAVGINAGSGSIDLGGGNLSAFDAELNAADVTIDLSRATTPDVRVSLNAGSARLQLPASSTAGSLSVNAGSLDLCAPASTGVRITVTSALASTDFGPSGLVRSGDTWTSPGYATATNRADLRLDANLASVSLNPAGGCQ